MMTAEQLIATLGLAPHPEGGFFAETFRSPSYVASDTHPDRLRSASTAIYFLLRTGDFSALHSVRSDEVWHHYLGDPLALSVIDSDGRAQRVLLGADVAAGQRPQYVVPAHVYQGAAPVPGACALRLRAVRLHGRAGLRVSRLRHAVSRGVAGALAAAP